MKTRRIRLFGHVARISLLARDAQAKLALIVAQCLTICVSVRDSLSHGMYAALRVASHVDYRLVIVIICVVSGRSSFRAGSRSRRVRTTRRVDCLTFGPTRRLECTRTTTSSAASRPWRSQRAAVCCSAATTTSTATSGTPSSRTEPVLHAAVTLRT